MLGTDGEHFTELPHQLLLAELLPFLVKSSNCSQSFRGEFQQIEVEFMTIYMSFQTVLPVYSSLKQSWGCEGRAVVCHIKTLYFHGILAASYSNVYDHFE